MTRLSASTVGKKVLMAASGALLVLFVIAHMLGNLKAFQGQESFDAYAEGIRTVGYPFLPGEGALWLVRLVLLVAVVVHVWAAWVLYRKSRGARGVGYRKKESLSFSYASRTMRWGGVILLAFIVYHILHFTTGQAHTDFVAGEPYRNLVIGFQNPLVSGSYVVAMAALAFHLYHGVWSAFQTLGANHPKYNRIRRPLAAAVSIVTFLGFIVVPVGVMVGLIS